MSATTERLGRSSLTSWSRLIWAFAVRDLKARFTTTSLGLVWALVVPLATVLIYSTVFSVIFRAQAPPMGNGHAGVFAVWFFCGLVTWTTFAQSAGTGLSSIVSMGPMLQKVYIPSYVPVLSSTLTIVFEKSLEALVMLASLLFFANIGWTWLLYPFVIAGVAVFSAGLAYVLAVANVHFRDMGHIFTVAMQLWFFVTPVMYPIDMIPAEWHGIPLRFLIGLNPMTHFVEIARDLLYSLRLPPLASVAYAGGSALATAGVAVLVYRRWGRDVSEAV